MFESFRGFFENELPFWAVLRECGRVALSVTALGLQLGRAAPPSDLRNYHLVFVDEFDTLDLGTRDDSLSAKPHKWHEGVWFSHQHAPRDCFNVLNSTLLLRWNRGQKQPDSSISTFSRNSSSYSAWRYGYFEARMKWKPQIGAWPAFWMVSVPRVLEATEDEESGEIDIFEGQGGEPTTFFGTIHRWRGSQELASSSARNRFPIPANTDFATYHTYGLLWVPGRVTWYFDGVPLHSESTYSSFDTQKYFIILGIQEGVDWNPGNLTGVTADTLSLTVDWVRVWQKQ
ncbi:MAG: glycoside hydrolase family 16 protein [Acidobacteriaceae bacterium]|nr:glycoside hydrolase family 16 protein [Acidobacteriaceae bacterium]